MQSAEGKPGRVFVIRLEDGDLLPDCLENFADEKNIQVGLIHIVGGLREGRMVVGPETDSLDVVEPIFKEIDRQPRETISLGIIAPDREGNPRAHIHGALGRGDETAVGCLRPGIETWLMGKVIVQEITDTDSQRIYSTKNKLSYLRP